jgi:AcrR family transcriptional regulator
MPRSARKTRQTILDAAYVQFRRRGYTRVSVDGIAAAARVTKRTLYYHFRSKDDLLEAVLEAQHELALTTFRNVLPPLRNRRRNCPGDVRRHRRVVDAAGFRRNRLYAVRD